jgi:DUF1680 family protein
MSYATSALRPWLRTLFTVALAAAVSEAGPITPAVREAARPLPLEAVRLTGGPLKHAQEADAAYLLTLEPDRMLAYYRQRAGLQPKAPPYGGWDGDGRNLTGHVAGHYLSAVSLMWAATRDSRFKQRADYIVDELKIVPNANRDGYVGAIAGAREGFRDLSRGIIRSAPFDLNGMWSPWYTLHKTFAGLRDAYRHAGNRTALEVEASFAGWVEGILSPLDDAQIQQMLDTEFGGMNEVLADLYADTGDRRWLALSHEFDHRAVLGPLERGEDRLDGLHGNTQVPKLVGAAVRYGYTGKAADLAAATTFWEAVVRHHTFATGGHGKDEHFREPDRLGNIVDGRTAETCNVYNMLKLTRRLFAWRPAIEYAEFQERALFNHIFGSIDPDSGAMCYMVPVGRGVRREYQDMQKDFTCCVGTGMESHALHALGLYYESGDRLWVNVYAPSTATWKAAGVRLEVETDLPDGDTVHIRLASEAPRSFTLALRRPSWAGDGFAVTINGERQRDVSAPGSYVELTRMWKTDDSVSLTLPKSLRLEPVADNPHRAAIMWGPLVLAGDLGPEQLPQDRAHAVSDPPLLVAAGRPVADWLKPAGRTAGTFRPVDAVSRGRDLQLVPFYRLQHRTYAAYWDIVTPADSDRITSERAAERARLQRLQAATVSFVPAGDPNGEKAFNLQGDGSSTVDQDGVAGRRASRWFSFDVPLSSPEVTPGQRGARERESTGWALVVTYNSDTRRARAFDILVDGAKVGTQSMPKSSVSRFFDVEYALPPALVRDKQRVTVRFQAAAGSEVAPVFGVRVVRAAGTQ